MKRVYNMFIQLRTEVDMDEAEALTDPGDHVTDAISDSLHDDFAILRDALELASSNGECHWVHEVVGYEVKPAEEAAETVSSAVNAQREEDLALVSSTAGACEWADFPASCQQWLEEHETLTESMRDRLESMLSRAESGEFDRRR